MVRVALSLLCAFGLALASPVSRSSLPESPTANSTVNAAINNATLSSAKQVEASADERDMLAIYAAYSGAAYTVSTKWDCPYACEYPGTEGTVVEYHWEVGFPESAGYIARNPGKQLIVVAFRGTDNGLQWLDNIDFWQTQWPAAVNDSYVHRGFMRGYLSVQSTVLSAVKEIAAKYPDYSIAVVGHSLGGAKAAICLLDLSLAMPELLPRLHLHTQGQPRVGNRGFANAINALGVPMSREVYEYDIIPRLPLESMGFRHHKFEVWDHDNKTLICLDPSPLDNCAEGDGIFRPSSVDDHVNYKGLKYQ